MIAPLIDRQASIIEIKSSVEHAWVEGIQRSVDFLRGQSIPMIQRGDMGEGQYAYFDGEPQLGVVLELLEKKRDSRAEP